MPLTPKQVRFVEEYMVTLCGKVAAERAGYSRRCATNRASILLSKPHIKAAVKAAKEARAGRVNVTAERVLEELAVVAFSDLKDHVDQGKTGTKLKLFEDMPGGASRALEAVSESRGPGGDRVAVKLHDKMKALDKLCQHLGICKERIDLSGKVDTELTIKVVKV